MAARARVFYEMLWNCTKFSNELAKIENLRGGYTVAEIRKIRKIAKIWLLWNCTKVSNELAKHST